jgi:hypothetical protein
MNVLKKSVLALAVAGAAASATAATVIPTDGVWVLSNEGISLGAYEQSKLTLRVIVDKQHDSGSKLKLTFPATVDLAPVVAAESLVDGVQSAVTETAPGSGVYQTANNEISINVGSGSFTFKGVTYNDDENSLEFESGIGQPLIGGASIEVTLGETTPATAAPRVLGAASVDFASFTAADAPIETGSSEIAKTGDQFAVEVVELMKETVDRLDNTVFVSGTATSTNGALKVTNNTSLKAQAQLDDINVNILADFEDSNLVTHTAADYKLSASTATSGVAPTLAALKNELKYVFDDAAEFSSAAASQTLDLVFASTGSYELQNVFNVNSALNYSWSGAATTDNGGSAVSYLPTTAFGEWKLDAAIVNVPYMPIGYQASNGIDAVFEISNHGPQDAEIVIRAFDQDGNTYGPLPLVDAAGGFVHNGFAAKNTVTKVSDKDVLETFGLVDGDKRKLNITFEIDAKRSDIDLVPYYKQDGVRAPIINSQYKDTAER